MSTICNVCNLTTEKTGKHYGAITCYACRAFFRRAQTRKRKLSCKDRGNCELLGEAKKFCPSCRYEQCLRAGMKPEFVLSEDDIKERFKHSRSSGSESTNQENTMLVPKQEEEYDDNSSSSINPGTSYVQVSVIQRALLKTEQDIENVTPPQDVFGNATIHQVYEHTNSFDTVYEDHNSELVSRLQSQNMDLTRQVSDQNRKINELTQELEKFKNGNNTKPTESVSPEISEENNSSVAGSGSSLTLYQSNEDDYDNLIMNYIHKKFKKTRENLATPLYVPPVESTYVLSDDSGNSSETERDAFEENFDIENEEEDIESLIQTLTPHLEDFQIEKKILEDMKTSFLVNWRSTNFGEDAMKLYMDFCAGRKEMNFPFWSYIFLQVRKRFLNFLADFDLIDLSHTKLFEVLSKNLRTSECMVYIYQLNADNSNDEIQFICGSQDLLQWQARDPSLQAGQIKNIIKAFPMAEKDKLLVLSYVNKLQTPILKDQTIFILTFLVALFNDDDDDEVRQLRTGILSLIQKYLSSLPGVSVTAEMVNIGLALAALPVLARCCNSSWSGHSTRRNIDNH